MLFDKIGCIGIIAILNVYKKELRADNEHPEFFFYLFNFSFNADIQSSELLYPEIYSKVSRASS